MVMVATALEEHFRQDDEGRWSVVLSDNAVISVTSIPMDPLH